MPVRIAHSHSSRQDRDYKYPLKLACKRLIPREATHLFACGVDAGTWMFGTDDFSVIPNAIDVDNFAFDEKTREKKRLELGIPTSAVVVGHVGRFSPVKNHPFLVDAFAGYRRYNPNAILLLAGDGPTRAAAESYAMGLGLQGSVRFLGVRSDVADLMQAMDVFVLPSHYEGLPVVLVEAQAAGLRCLVSDGVPSDCDISEGAVERLPLDGGASEWASALSRIVENPVNRRRGAADIKRAGFDVGAVSAQLQRFYLSSVGRVM